METTDTVSFQKREWVVERVGWVVMVAVLIAAMAGLFGDGTLSSTSASTADGAVRLSYSRFARMLSPTVLRVEVSRAANGDRMRLSLPAQYVTEDVKVERVTPEPLAVELEGNQKVTYVFHSVAPGGVVTFDVQARRAGRLSGALQVGEDPPLIFDQYVYP